MTTTATKDGATAARNGQPQEACPHALGSPAHRDWIAGWQSQASLVPSAGQSDTSLETSGGISSEELADVIGADDYEAGAETIAAPATPRP